MLLEQMSRREFNAPMRYYLDLAHPGASVDEVLERSGTVMARLIDSIPDTRFSFQYSPTSWTIGEVIQHVISYEEIMTERALVVAGRPPARLRHDRYTQLGTIAGGRDTTKDEFASEWTRVRSETRQAFAGLESERLTRIGTLDGNRASVRAIGLCISGHQAHHMNDLHTDYRQPRP